MNVTDVDDKIILRARQQHFTDLLKAENPSKGSVPETVLKTAREAFTFYLKNLPNLPPTTSPETYGEEARKGYGELIDRIPADESEAKKKMHLKALESAAQALQRPGDVADFYAKADDILFPYLGEINKVGL
jgi:cysteinyl-tRNA synthetase